MKMKEKKEARSNLPPNKDEAMAVIANSVRKQRERRKKIEAAKLAQKQKQREAAKAKAKSDVKRKPGAYSPNPNSKRQFYQSWEWRKLRMEALQRHGHRCQSCGASKENITIYGAMVRLVVDHIEPLGVAWERRLDPENLQVLCDECNMGKGGFDVMDFRTPTGAQHDPTE